MEPQVGIEQLIQALPLTERVPILALKNYHDQRSNLDQEQEVQLELVRRKYREKIKPLLERAAELIQGSVPTAQEVALLPQYLKAGEKAGQLKGKIIENYWASALQNSRLESFVTEKDERALEYLLNIIPIDDVNDPESTCFKFVFKANPYFQETTATRRLKAEGGVPISLEGDVMTPKAGNWLTHEMKKVNNKNTGDSKIIQGKKIDSFFDIFLNWSVLDNPKELQKCVKIFQELQDVVDDSFSHFLGLYDIEDSEDVGDYEEEEIQDEK